MFFDTLFYDQSALKWSKKGSPKKWFQKSDDSEKVKNDEKLDSQKLEKSRVRN